MRFVGIEVFEAIALYSDIKIYKGEFNSPESKQIGSSEAFELIANSPESIWAEVDEAEIERTEKDPVGTI